MSIEDSYNFRRIDERVTTSGVVDPENLAVMRDEGYGAVINLMPDSESPVADEAGIVREQGVDYVYIPIDFNEPKHADLEAFVAAMDAVEGKVHVHCAANFRVSAFYGLYAVKRGTWTRDEADEFVGSLWDTSEFPAWASFIETEREQA